MILYLDLNNSSSRFCTLATLCSEMLKVRKSTKEDFNGKVNIFQITAVKVSKFPRTLSLDLSNSSSKFGNLILHCSKMLKVRKIAKSDLNSWLDISQTTTVKPSKFCLMI